MTFNVTIELGKYDEDLGYRGSNPRPVGSYKTEQDAIKAAKAVSRDSTNIPASEGFTVLAGEYKGKTMARELVRLHIHPFGMNEEQRRAAKKAQLKALRYEPVKVTGEPKEGEVYYFANGTLVDEKEIKKKKALKAMLGRVANEYFAKYYDERPWEGK